MYGRFKRLLLQIQAAPSMEVQKELLTQFFQKWRGELSQLDDVCILGGVL